MSHAPHSLSLPIERDSLRRAVDVARETVWTALHNVRVASFWAAIVLPFAYFPLLLGGLTGGESLLFVGLVTSNAIAFVLGHEYDPATASDGVEQS